MCFVQVSIPKLLSKTIIAAQAESVSLTTDEAKPTADLLHIWWNKDPDSGALCVVVEKRSAKVSSY